MNYANKMKEEAHRVEMAKVACSLVVVSIDRQAKLLSATMRFSEAMACFDEAYKNIKSKIEVEK